MMSQALTLVLLALPLAILLPGVLMAHLPQQQQQARPLQVRPPPQLAPEVHLADLD
jgi:hypothetical protein